MPHAIHTIPPNLNTESEMAVLSARGLGEAVSCQMGNSFPHEASAADVRAGVGAERPRRWQER